MSENSSSFNKSVQKFEAEQASTSFARDQLKSIVERIERLEEEKKATSDDISDVYKEAKGNGFDTKALRQVVKLRKMDADERREHELILETYLQALGMLSDVPPSPATTGRDRSRPESVANNGFAARLQRTADLAEEAAGLGLISPEAAAETKHLTKAISEKFGEDGTFKRRVQRKVKAAFSSFGTPRELTEEEKAQGMQVGFTRPDGTHVSMAFGEKL